MPDDGMASRASRELSLNTEQRRRVRRYLQQSTRQYSRTVRDVADYIGGGGLCRLAVSRYLLELEAAGRVLRGADDSDDYYWKSRRPNGKAGRAARAGAKGQQG